MPTYSGSTSSVPGVYVNEAAFTNNVARANTSQSVAAFLGTAPRGPVEATLINSWSGFKSLYGDISIDHELGYSVYHYFANGGRDAYITRVVSVNEENPAVAASGTVKYYPTGQNNASASLFTVDAISVGDWGNNLSLSGSSGTTAAATTQISLNGTEVERWNDVSTDPASNRYIDTVVNTYSKFIRVTTDSSAKTASNTWSFFTDATSLTGGDDGAEIADADYVSALDKYDIVEGVLIINAPGRTSATVVTGLLTYAENRGNSFVVIDPTNETDATQIGTAIVSTYPQSSYGAVYYPMLKMADPTKTGPAAIRDTYPGGAVMGAYIRTEVARTVAKAPAGYNVDIRNAYGLTGNFTEAQAATLYNDYGVNLFKAVPGGGIIINGTRTLDKATPGKFIPIRRSMNYLKQALKDTTSFAVFEPNDERLWTTINMRVGSLLGEFWRAGGLKGRNSAEAFYIVCDETNNTNETIAQGEVRLEVGVALQYPAEFIVINISQWTGGANSVANL
jgi:phage tail sheath protein FI